MAIEFFDNDNTSGSASIYEAYITFNKSLEKFLENVYRARVGVDKDDKKIYIFTVSKEYAQSGEISSSSLLTISISKSYARICSRAMLEYIIDIFNLNIPKGGYLRYDAKYDEQKKAIVIDLEDKNV